MSNIEFRSIPAQAWANNQSGHYSTELIPWFRSAGQPSDFPSTFTPDLGTQFTFSAPDAATALQYIYDRTDPFWPQEGSFDKGFALQSPNSKVSQQFNNRIVGGKGHWMPAPIFRSLSFYWSKEVDNAKAWYVQHVAVVLKNWKTDEEKTFGFNHNSQTSSSRVIILNNGIEAVRAMGPDWFVYGVIFNVKSPSTNGSDIGKSRLVDFPIRL